MSANNNLIRYELETDLEKYSPFERSSGYLKDIKEEFNYQKPNNFLGFVTVNEYSKDLRK